MDGLIVGRIVYLVPVGAFNDRRAAVITHIWDKITGLVNLYVFPDGSTAMGSYTPTSVQYSKSGTPGTWHFIEES